MKKLAFSKIYPLLIAGSLAFILSACEFGPGGMNRSTGRINELLIVTDSKAQWQGQLGDTLRAVFEQDLVGLSQPESIFDVLNIASKDLGDLYKPYHNIFIANINPKDSSASLTVANNVWSEPQCVITLSAPDLESFVKEFESRKDTILNDFIMLERKRTLGLDELASDVKISGEIESKFGMSLPISSGFYLATTAPGFMWLRYVISKPKQDTELGILIYSGDFPDSVAFNERHIINWRNMITKEHIPGPSAGSYMMVSDEYIQPVFKQIRDFPSGYAIETRGLWMVHNDYMGGPFLSYTFINPKNHQVITLDGYVYNPNSDKKDYLRHLEAIFWAVKF